MAEYVNVAVDAMGGDNAPTEIVKGAVEAVNADKRVKVFLVGKEPVIREELKAYTYENPKVGIVNIGAEEEKGNALVKETFPLLKNCPEINFIGSVEARDIPAGVADVIVCEAFVGNVVLKMYEGVSSALLHQVKQGMMSTLRSKIGALLVKPALKKTLKSFDTSQYGGAPLLGLNGLVVKTHGSSKAVEVKNSILQCIAFKEEKINEKIKEQIGLEDKAAENN